MLGLHCCVRVFSSCWKWVLLFSFSAQACNCSGFPAAQTVKNPPAMWETWVRYLSWEDPLEKEMVTHSSILAWRITWTEEPGRLQSMGSQRVGHDWATCHFTTPLLLQSTGSRCMGFNNYSTWVLQLQLAGSRAWAQQIWCTGLGAPWHVESSQTRNQTCVLCISKQIPIHWATREVSVVFLNSASSNAQHRTCHKTDA